MTEPTKYYDEKTIIFLDGKWKKASECGLDLFSQTMHYGTGVFEGIRAYETPTGPYIFEAKDHFRRLYRSSELFNVKLDYTIDELVEFSYQLLEKNRFTNAYIRPLIFLGPKMSLTLSNEPHLLLAAWPWKPLLGDDLVRVMISSYIKPNPGAMPVEAKISGQYINSILATTEARNKGFDEALLLDAEGNIAQGPGANIFFEMDGELITPPKGNIMPGITRDVVIDLAKMLGHRLVERVIRPEEISKADAAFFTGTACEIAGIKSIGGHEFETPWEETLAHEIFLMYRNRVHQKDVADFTLS